MNGNDNNDENDKSAEKIIDETQIGMNCNTNMKNNTEKSILKNVRKKNII